MRFRNAIQWALTAVAVLPAVVHGQADWSVDALRRGEITDSLVSLTDPAQSYAVYLPSNYDLSDPPPVVLVLDARGRALVPLRRMVEGAERVGYMVISSYNSASDGPVEPNRAAVNAMLGDLQGPLPGAVRTTVLVGFSGTARLAWAFGWELRPHVRAVVGFGAGPVEGMNLTGIVAEYGSPFGYFGGAGRVDFNYDELVLLEDRLDALGVHARFRYYSGPHAWPPETVFTEALEWVKLREVRLGRERAPPGWIDTLWRRRLGHADSLEAAGARHQAWREYRALADDFAGLRPTETAEHRARELESASEVLIEADRRRRTAEEYFEYSERVARWLATLRRLDPIPPLERSLEELAVEEILNDTDAADPAEGAAAERKLASLVSYLSFYEPRRYMERREFDRAVAALRIADTIRPGRPNVCLFLARAEAARGRPDVALEHIECVFDAGWTPRVVESQPELTEVVRSEGYRKLRREGGP